MVCMAFLSDARSEDKQLNRTHSIMRISTFRNTLILGSLFVLSMLRMAAPAVVFKDDFSDCTQSSINWIANNTTDVVPKCSSGVYAVSNTNTSYLGQMYHSFSPSKPAVFTSSCIIKRSSDNTGPGLLVCLKMGAKVTGYLVQIILASNIQLVKYVDNTSTILFSQTTPVMQGFNDICISKKGDSITVFCNNLFVKSCVDPGSLAAGDIGLGVSPNSSAIFDDVSVSDTFRRVPPQGAGFIDDFNDNSLATLWLDYGSNDDKEETDGFLKLGTTTANARAYVFINTRNIKLDMDTFAAKICVSHRGGNMANMFGFFISGDQDNTGSVPLANFGIDGNRCYRAYRGGESITLAQSSLIHGTGYWDTMEVIKKSNSSYALLVNRVVLDSLPAAKVDFLITGAGIFVDQGMSVWVDRFQIGPDITSAVRHPSMAAQRIEYRVLKSYSPDRVFNPMGRVVWVLKDQGLFNARELAPGCYLTGSQKYRMTMKIR
jgi:hypothetical protein